VFDTTAQNEKELFTWFYSDDGKSKLIYRKLSLLTFIFLRQKPPRHGSQAAAAGFAFDRVVF